MQSPRAEHTIWNSNNHSCLGALTRTRATTAIIQRSGDGRTPAKVTLSRLILLVLLSLFTISILTILGIADVTLATDGAGFSGSTGWSGLASVQCG